MYITDYLAKHAAKTPDKLALVYGDKRYSWAELYEKVETVAAVIAKRVSSEIQAVVSILLPNSPEFLITYLGIIHAGHIAMPLDPNFKALEVQTVNDQMKPVLAISNLDYERCFRESDAMVLATDLIKQPAAKAPPQFLRSDPKTQIASMLFTSGTTGNPKAVPYTHANHMWNVPAVSDMWHWTSEDTILLSLPLSHWHGLVMGVDGALYHGNTLYLQERFDPAETVKALQSGDITLFMHVPIAYSKLVEYAGEKSFDISKVRLCISGSSYLPPVVWEGFKSHFGQDILERYGANEMGLITSNTPEKRLSGCVGKVLEDVTIEFQPSGEIAMKSPGLFPGYWSNDEASQSQRTKNGLWLSGDIGEIDSEGYLHLKGRVQEKMKKLGYTVYPRDVEWALMKLSGIDEAAVISLQHEGSLSDEFIYFVVGKATDDKINSYAKKEMPTFWRPDRIIHLDAIPRTGRTSKPAIKELRALALKPDTTVANL